MKINTLLLIISLLFFKAGFTQSNHSITIDGNNNEWSGLETFTNCSSADNAYFTWDADYIYFGIKDAEADYGNLGTFIYLDTDPSGSNGSNNAYTWDNFITTPFNTDWVIVWKNNPGSDYIEIRKYVTGNWNQIASSSSTSLTYNSVEVVKFAIGTDYREVRIKRSLLDNPIAIKLASLTQQDYGSKWRYFVWPSNDWTDKANGAGQSIPNYYGFILKDQISQINSPYYNADIKSFDGDIGGTATDWATAANWAPDGLPGVNTLTLIPNGKSVNIAASSTADAYDLVVEGSLTIKSMGSLITKGTFAGTATVERDVTNAEWGNWKDGWHFLSSPVTKQAISPAFTTDPYDFYTWWEATNEWVNFKNTTTAPTWNTANSSSTNFIVGKGYMAAYDAGGTKKFEGTLNVDDVPVSGLAITGTTQTNRSWHLLGNPFSCALIWDASGDWNRTNIAGVAQIWNESIQDYSLLTSNPATVIPATNGFMVQASGGTGSLTIPITKRDHSAQPFYKSSENEIPQLKLFCSTADKQSAKESSIMLYPEATEGYDLMYDGEFLQGFGPSFYSQQGDLKLSLNALPELPLESRIPFSFIKNDATQFSIELKQNIDGYTPYLKDKKSNTVQNLSENPVYNFTSEDGDDPNRFELSFLAPTSLDKPGTQSQLRVYTANGKFNISGVDGKAEVLVRNIMGQVVLRNSVNGEKFYSVNSANLPAGVYVVSVVSGTQTVSQKVVVK